MPSAKPIFETTVTERLPLPIAYIKPMPIPSTAWNDAPLRCIKINAQWASYLLGLVDLLDAPDAWQGSKVQVDAARDQVREIALAIAGAYECETSEMGIQDIRLDATCNVIEVLINGVWTPKIAKDLLYPPLYFTSEPNVEDNVIYWDYSTNSDCVGGSGQIVIDLPAGAQGPPGEQGIPGEVGDIGPIGPPGDCACEDTSSPPVTTVDDDACGIATYLVDWHDGIFDDFINAVDAAASVTEAITNFLPLIPGVGTVAEILVEAATAAIGATAASMRAEVTNPLLEEWRCDLYCRLREAGQYSDTLINAWLTDTLAATSTLGAQTWLKSFQAYSIQEKNRRAVIGAATPNAECATLCDCETDPTGTVYDFAVSNQGWEAANSVTVYDAAGGHWWIPSSPATSQDNVQVRRVVPAGSLTRLIVTAEDTGPNNRLFVGKGGLGVQRASGAGPVYDVTLSSPIVFDGVTELLVVSLDWTGGSSNTHPQKITKIELIYS